MPRINILNAMERTAPPTSGSVVDSPHTVESTHPQIPKTIGILSDHFFIPARPRVRSTNKPNQIGFERGGLPVAYVRI